MGARDLGPYLSNCLHLPAAKTAASRLHLTWQFATISVPKILDLSSVSLCGNIS